MNKVIVTPHCNRPKYTKQVVDSLYKAKGIQDYIVYASVEPGNDEVLKIVKEIDEFCTLILNVNDERLGCNVNIFKSIYLGFTARPRPQSVLVIEDDIPISKDALVKYEEWANRNDKGFSFCLYNRVLEKDYRADQYNLTLKRDTFVPWGVAYSYDSFIKMIDWNVFGQTATSWDVALDQQCKKRGLKHDYMFLSRSQNIGAEGGVHVPSPEWHAIHHHLPFWAGDLDK